MATIEPFYVADTHALIWYLRSDKKLSAKAAAIFEAAKQGQSQIIISAISIAELYYANQKNHFFADFSHTYRDLKDQPYIQIVDFNADDVLDFDQDAAVPEMHDRIITGLARRIGVPLLTHDPDIHAAAIVNTVW